MSTSSDQDTGTEAPRETGREAGRKAESPQTPWDLVVIGSGPAGVSAARGYRDAGGTGRVLMVTADGDPPYERPPLSKEVLAGEAPAEGQPLGDGLLPEDVELRLGTTVSAVDLDGRRLRAGSEDIAFTRLVVATGSNPQPLPAAEPEAQVYLLRSLDDARRLVEAAGHARSAVVIGSGFIGCEGAASLAGRGLDVTLVTPEDTPQEARLGAEAGDRIATWLKDTGVSLRTGTKVTGIQAPCTVHLDDGATLSPDLVLAAVGVEQNGGVLSGTGAEVHEDGRVAADQTLQVTPGVWVAGDVARAEHAVAGRAVNVEHWGDALAMGELAGHRASLDEHGWAPTLGAQRAGELTGTGAAGKADAPGRNAATDDSGGANATEDADDDADDTESAQGPVWDTVPGFWSTIGGHTLKYSAWGDGFETARLIENGDRFTVWYGDADGELVGVLTHEVDEDYERGRELIARRATVAEVLD